MVLLRKKTITQNYLRNYLEITQNYLGFTQNYLELLRFCLELLRFYLELLRTTQFLLSRSCTTFILFLLTLSGWVILDGKQHSMYHFARSCPGVQDSRCGAPAASHCHCHGASPVTAATVPVTVTDRHGAQWHATGSAAGKQFKLELQEILL